MNGFGRLGGFKGEMTRTVNRKQNPVKPLLTRLGHRAQSALKGLAEPVYIDPASYWFWLFPLGHLGEASAHVQRGTSA